MSNPPNISFLGPTRVQIPNCVLIDSAVFERPFVKPFAPCHRTVVCRLSCPVCPVSLSVTLVYCGQTVERIKMKLLMEVGLSPGHTGHQLPPRKAARLPPLFGPCLLWPNGRPSQQLLSSCCTTHGRVDILHNGPPPFPLKIAPFQRGIWTPSNAWFLGLTRVRNRNGISIGSAAVFAGLTTVIDRQTTLLGQ